MNPLSYIAYDTKTPLQKSDFGNQKIFTQLPKTLAVARAVTALAIAAIQSYLPIAAIALAYSGWVVYSHLLTEYPLVAAFYKICDGKEQFEQLPFLECKGCPEEITKNLTWQTLEHPIYRSETPDKRKMMIVKGLDSHLPKKLKAF